MAVLARCARPDYLARFEMIMRCPICKKLVDMSKENRFRPFCSERCHLVDLGTWASGDYRVAGGKVDDTEHPDDRPKPKIIH
jgi:uncharacterized protein